MSKALLPVVAASLLWGNFAVAAYQDVVLADHPVAYYRFEETSGTTANDSSGNSNNGTYMNGVVLGQPSAPLLGKAGTFDGIAAYVSTLRTVSTDFTLELWINTSASSLTGSFAYEGSGLLWSDVGGAANDFVVGMLNNGMAFDTGNPDVNVTSADAINDGRWHHLVATRTQGTGVEIFVDGVSRGTASTNGSPLDGNASIMVGGNVLDSRYFSGLIDEVAYYPTVLTPERIRAHYLAGTVVPAVPVPSLGAWPMTALVAVLTLFGLHGVRRRRT